MTDRIKLDVNSIPPIGSKITSWGSPFGEVTGEVVEIHEQKRSGLLMLDRGGVSIQCTGVVVLGNQKFIGDKLFLQYGTEYEILSTGEDKA